MYGVTSPSSQVREFTANEIREAYGAWARETFPRERGAFVTFEGVAKSGKSTLVSEIAKRIAAEGRPVKVLTLPNPDAEHTGALLRDHESGRMPLRDSSCRTLHSLYSNNRWESARELCEDLAAGVTVLCERYAHGGVASAHARNGTEARALDRANGVTRECLMLDDCGLPQPDLVIFMSASAEDGGSAVATTCARRNDFGAGFLVSIESEDATQQALEDMMRTAAPESAPWLEIHMVGYSACDSSTVDRLRATIDANDPCSVAWQDANAALETCRGPLTVEEVSNRAWTAVSAIPKDLAPPAMLWASECSDDLRTLKIAPKGPYARMLRVP